MHIKYINPYKLFNGSFVPEWLMTTDLISSNAKIIYARLCRYAGNSDKAYPRLEELSDEVGLPLTTMRRALKELVDNKMIESKRRGLGIANDYYFLWHPLMDNPECPPVDNQECPSMDNQECPYVDTPITRESDKRVRQENNINILKAPKTKHTYSENYEDWWKHYKKGNKFNAYKHWKSWKLDDCYDEVVKGTVYYLNSQRVKDGYKLDAEKFLKNRTWESFDDGTQSTEWIK